MGQKKLKSFSLEDFIKFLHTPRYNIGEFHIEGKKLVFDFSTGLSQIKVDGVRVWSGIGKPVTTNPEKLLTEWLTVKHF